MNIKEIITRETGPTIKLSEMQFVIQQYIKERKGVDILINLFKRIDQKDPFAGINYAQQVEKLINAFNTASIWYMKNKFKVK